MQVECGELFDTAALAISIALDALVPAEAPPVPSPPAEPAPSAPPTPPPEPSPERPAPLSPAHPAKPSTTSRPTYFAGGDLLASHGSAPSLAIGGVLFTGVRAGLFSLALELSAEAPASTRLTGDTVTSWLYAGSLVPCAHYGITALCAEGAFGSLQGESSALGSVSKHTLFAAAGGRAGVEWKLTNALSARLHIDLLRNLAPTTLAIGSETWSAPSLIVSGGAGIVVHFP
jgi:hypothetical protein